MVAVDNWGGLWDDRYILFSYQGSFDNTVIEFHQIANKKITRQYILCIHASQAYYKIELYNTVKYVCVPHQHSLFNTKNKPADSELFENLIPRRQYKAPSFALNYRDANSKVSRNKNLFITLFANKPFYV